MAAKKLLVADDSLTIQKVIRLALSNEGYEIHAVSDGNDAVQQISLFRPDVVLIDVSLPGKSAFEVKRTINEHSDLQDIRFVLMSSAFEKVDEEQASEVIFHGRLTKPFDPANLREILQEVVAQVASRKSERTQPSIARPAAPAIPPRPPAFSAEDDEKPYAPASVDDLAEEISPDQDIRQLTESTIRMSGLDDFQWNVQEPSLKTTPEMQDSGNSNFPLHETPASGERDELSLNSPGNAYYNAPDPAQDGLSMTNFELPIPSKEESANAVHVPTPLPTPAPAHASLATAPALNEAEIEALIHKKVEEALQKMAQSLLPEVTERIVKQEIHRLLSEQP